jgi:BlaI family penicillinase repressor
MATTPRISDAEWAVMEILWQQHPVTAVEVVQKLGPTRQWQNQTIRTMLRRLIDKGAVSYRAEGKVYYYKPVVSREKCVRVESRSFLTRVFGGAAKPLLVQMVQDADLSPEDISELEALLAKKGKK